MDKPCYHQTLWSLCNPTQDLLSPIPARTCYLYPKHFIHIYIYIYIWETRIGYIVPSLTNSVTYLVISEIFFICHCVKLNNHFCVIHEFVCSRTNSRRRLHSILGKYISYIAVYIYIWVNVSLKFCYICENITRTTSLWWLILLGALMYVYGYVNFCLYEFHLGLISCYGTVYW